MTTSPKRIVISGWFGNNNLGDEAILTSTLAITRRILPDAEITVFSDDPEKTKSEHEVPSIKRRGVLSMMNRLNALFRADLFLLGGGGLLYDSGMGGEVVHWLRGVILAKLTGTPTMYLNGGVGLIYNRISKYCMKQVCNTMDLITVRDHISKSYLEALGIGQPIHVSTDSVMAFAEAPFVTCENHSDDLKKSGPILGINVRPWLYIQEDIPAKDQKLSAKYSGGESDFVKFRKSIAGAIDYLRKVSGARIVFFPICLSNKAMDEDDLAISDEIAQSLADCNGVHIIRDEKTFSDLINRMKDLDVVIAMRLHALVFAALLRKAMLAISYDPKVNAFMDSLGLGEYTLNVNEVTRDLLIKKIDLIWENREVISERLRKRTPKLARTALSSADLIHSLIRKKKVKSKLISEGVMLAIKVLPCIPFYFLQRSFNLHHRLRDLPWGIRISLIMEKLV